MSDWIRAHRKILWAAWAAVGIVAMAVVLFWGPDTYYLRGAPLPRRWMALFFLALWGWLGLRAIALWPWAWVVMAWAPVFLFLPLRFYLDAWWLLPLLLFVALASALTVAAVVTMQLRRRRA